MEFEKFERSPVSVAVGGVFHFEQIRDGKVIDAWDESNLVVNEGLTSVLNVYFKAGTQITAWYIGLFEGNYTPVAGDTMAAFVAAATESTAYTETVRQTYTTAAVAAQSITNAATKATFSINATKTMYGAFMSSVSTKSATTGTLVAAAKFAAARSLVSGDQLLVTYVFTATSA